MITLIFAILLLLLAAFGVGLQKAYGQVPLKELKRRARQGDTLAMVLYRAAAYGGSLELLIWIYIGVTAAGGLVLLSRSLPAPLGFFAVLGVIWYGFAWLPSGRLARFSLHVAVYAAPVVAWLVQRLHPLLGSLARLGQRYRHVSIHTGLYERGDLLALLEQQKQTPDSRISPEELDLAIHALSFNQMTVEQVMVPQRVVRVVASTDVIGPILLDELHTSGHSRFPVFDTAGSVIGLLMTRDAIAAKHGGTVSDIMRRSVHYVHEDYALYQVLHAFLTTRQHLFIVVNSFEEYVGIITIDDILEQIIGQPIHDEFDAYDDMRAVARSQAETEHQERVAAKGTVAEVDE